MLAIDILRNTTEERECEGGFDVFMAIDRGCDGLDNALANAIVARKSTNFLLVFLC